MDLHALPFTAADELAGLLALALALVAWKRRQQPGARAFALGAFCTFWWCSLHGVSLLAANLQAKYIMIQFWYPGPAIAAWAYLTFAIQYSWPSLRLSKRLLALLAASPTLTLLALWTNPLHHLFWTTLYLDRNGPFPMFGIVHGPLFGASLVLADIAIGLNCALLLRLAFKHKGLYRDQAALVILGGAVACGSELMYVTGHTPLPSLDFTPLILSVSAALFGWALFGPRLLDMIPVAHELIMDAVADAVIVLDAQERVVYLNRAARNLEGATIGRPLDSSLSEITRLLTETPPQAEGRSELRRGVSRQLTVFDVRVAPVLDGAGAIRGRSVVLRDVSEHQLVDQLQRSRKDIIAAEESIRREIAEMLHGSVQTKLLAAWFRLGEFERQWPLPADAARELSDIRAALDRIREEDVRQASHLLHPSVIRVGLVPAIDYLAAGLSDVLRIDVKADRALRALDRIGEDGLPDELRLVAYRVVEEALNNVAKHSAAGGVAITLDVTDGSLHMAVADDGHGFDPAMVRPGLGFGSIAGRVEHYGGAWQVDSKPGHGAIVEAWLPLNPAPAPTALPIVDSVPPVAALSQV